MAGLHSALPWCQGPLPLQPPLRVAAPRKMARKRDAAPSASQTAHSAPTNPAQTRSPERPCTCCRMRSMHVAAKKRGRRGGSQRAPAPQPHILHAGQHPAVAAGQEADQSHGQGPESRHEDGPPHEWDAGGQGAEGGRGRRRRRGGRRRRRAAAAGDGGSREVGRGGGGLAEMASIIPCAPLMVS